MRSLSEKTVEALGLHGGLSSIVLNVLCRNRYRPEVQFLSLRHILYITQEGSYGKQRN